MQPGRKCWRAGRRRGLEESKRLLVPFTEVAFWDKDTKSKVPGLMVNARGKDQRLSQYGGSAGSGKGGRACRRGAFACALHVRVRKHSVQVRASTEHRVHVQMCARTCASVHACICMQAVCSCMYAFAYVRHLSAICTCMHLHACQQFVCTTCKSALAASMRGMQVQRLCTHHAHCKHARHASAVMYIMQIY